VQRGFRGVGAEVQVQVQVQVQRCEVGGEAEVQRCRGTEVQRCRGAEMQMQRCRCKGAQEEELGTE
jgi:hypothetical protein